MLNVINTCIHLYNPSCFLYNFLFLRRTILMCKSIHRQRYKGLVLKSCGKKSTFQIIRYRKNWQGNMMCISKLVGSNLSWTSIQYLSWIWLNGISDFPKVQENAYFRTTYNYKELIDFVNHWLKIMEYLNLQSQSKNNVIGIHLQRHI